MPVPAKEMRLDRDRQLAHVQTGRKNAAGVHVVVHDAVVDGDQLAAATR